MKDPKLLVGGYAAGSLNKSESKHLMKAALENQDLFDELLDVEPLRNALANPELRAQIRADLRERVERQGLGIGEKLRRLFFRPGVIPAFSVVLTALLVVLLRQGFVNEHSGAVQVALGAEGVPLLRAAGILDARSGESERLREVQSEPVRKSGDGGLGFDRSGNDPSYRVGDPMRLGFKVEQDSSVVMLEQASDGAVTRLYPNRFQSSSRVSAGETIWVPPAGQGPLQVDGPAGRHVVQVLVFPPGVDPLDPAQNWDKIRGQASVLEKTYEVAP